MNIVGRLSIIQQEIQAVETEKLQCEERLALFWEHPPALDADFLGRFLQSIRDRIRLLEDRRMALLEERQALIVEGASSNRWGM